MARIRSIKPEFFTSLTLADCTPEQRLTFIGLWTYVDDNGVGIDEPRLIRAAVWPLDDRTIAEIDADVEALQSAGVIIRYEAGNRRYLAVRNFQEHQKISHPRKNRYPSPAETGKPDGTPPDQPSSQTPEERQSPPEDDQSPPDSLRPEQGSGSRDQGSGIREGDAHAPERAREPSPAASRAAARAPIDDAGFRVTDGMRRWAHQTFPRVDLDYETAQFLDHFRGEGTRRRNWANEWQKWIRRANQWAAEHAARLQTASGAQVIPFGRGAPLAGTDARVAEHLALAERLRVQEAGGLP